MAIIVGHPTVKLTVTIQLEEAEALALDALVGYGDDAFLQCFYKNMGESYLKPHEGGLRLLFSSLRNALPSQLSRARDARKVFELPTADRVEAVHQAKKNLTRSEP